MIERKTILEIKDLHLAYAGDDALIHSAEVSVKEGEMVVLVGSNGAGKSTLLRTITNMQRAAGGDILLDGRAVSSYSAREFASKVSFVGAASILVENLSVFELVSMGRHPYTNWWGRLSSEDTAKVIEAIGFVGMSDFVDVKVTRLSDGERQRIMIARALAQNTPLMIFDEPTAFLDIPNRMSVAEVLHKLKDAGHSVIMSTHDFDAAFQYADKMWVLDDQDLIEGAPEDLGMNGVLDKLFMQSEITLDHRDLRYKRKKELKSLVNVNVKDPKVNLWLARALNRVGLAISEENTNVDYTIHYNPESPNQQWSVSTHNNTIHFPALYDVVLYLTQE